MNPTLLIPLLAWLTLTHALAQTTPIYPGKAARPETDVSAAFAYEAQYFDFEGSQVHYYESGEGDPVLFLHGIPTWSYLWRNVVAGVDDNKRAIALDFLGYGKSDLPADGDYSLQRQYEMLSAFIAAHDLRNITLVVNDLGSAVGLKYAMAQPDRIKGIVLIEAAFMEPEAWYEQLTTMQKMMFGMMRKRKTAERFMVKRNMGGKMMVPMFTKRKLSQEEKAMYAMPFEEEARRYVLIDGPGPHHIPKKMVSQEAGDFADVMADYAAQLRETDIPMLLIYAKKGLINRKAAIEYAQTHFEPLELAYIGKGKHFLPESHPRAIAAAINSWYLGLTELAER